MSTAEADRLDAARERQVAWRRWGPYLSERQWGTVREDYSPNGDAWTHFPHDQARSRAYRWGEDGLLGISDDKQRLCFALALWNGADPILKERMFGLTNAEGNHGEDVKEYYFYLDSTPTHSYMRALYKYPQRAFPYAALIEENRRRGRETMEYELLDTGVFAESRYFDVFVEYAKATPEDVLIEITVWNRGPQAAALHLLPTLWCRNTWAAPDAPGTAAPAPRADAPAARPQLRAAAVEGGASVVAAEVPGLGTYRLRCAGAPEPPPLLFTENETNRQRLFGAPNATPYVKDGINEYLVEGRAAAVNPALCGTKAAAHYRLTVAAGGSARVRLRLSTTPPADAAPAEAFGEAFAALLSQRRQEADDFYAAVAPPDLEGTDEAAVMRQALAGMLWSKQYYYFDVDRWLEEHEGHPARVLKRLNVRNRDWFHMLNDDVISMPDKWEYPWYAAWDLAFHAVALAMVDLDFAKEQLELMLRELYLHPNGQIPAYEWNFGDVNPPVHAWATLFVFRTEQERRGKGDLRFLRRAFHKLLVNFTWWVNRKDPGGRNVFEGGFLGLDNIGVFDRSAPLPTGGHLEQADGTAWMALFAQNMLEMALLLAADDPLYEDFALKFLEHFLWIASAMDRIGDNQDELWDEADGFFYDVLRLPDGSAQRLKVRSMVGLLPLCATTVIDAEVADRFPRLRERMERFLRLHPALQTTIAPVGRPGVQGRRLLGALNEPKLRRVLAYLLDEDEFFSPYGVRALSRYHADRPYVLQAAGQEHRVDYQPAESESALFGGNSNWRGPVWFPMNILLIRALLQLYSYYGDALTVDCPTGSGQSLTLFQVARELSGRLTAIFLRDATGRRPVYGGTERFQTDPHWRDLILFYEYFHGDNGAGLGASHQTGWTGLVARLIQMSGALTPRAVRERGALSTVHYRAGPGPGPSTGAASQ